MMLQILKEKPADHVSKLEIFDFYLRQIKYMLIYLEKQFGERALNGDFEQSGILKAKIKEVENKLEA